MQLKKIWNSHGQVLISLLVVLPSLILIVAAYLSLSANSFRLSRQDQLHSHAQLAADAGADYALEQISANENWAGSGGEQQLQNDGQIKSTYDLTVTANGQDSKTITATGKSYWPAGSTSPGATVKLSISLRPVRTGSYSIVSGEGGLIMSNTAKIVGGDVFINGGVDMKNTAQIGLSTNPVKVYVANQLCPIPADATYPRLCNSGENDNPIKFNNTPHIYGEVRANHQTNGANMSDPGLIASSGVDPQPLPSVDRAGIKAAITTTNTGASASCSSGTKTWAANTKITGDVTLSNSCHVTVQGNIWITGMLTVKNSAQMIVADSLATTRPIIMVDSVNGADLKNSAKLVSNASSTGFEIVTFYSTAACSPDCASVTGVDLYNSRSKITVSIDNTTEGAQSIYYAYWSQVLVKNSGQIGALIGQTVELKNSGTITFGTSIQGGGTTTWVVSGYKRVFD